MASANIYDLSAYINPIVIWTGGSFSPPTYGNIEVARIVANFIQKRYPSYTFLLYFVPVSKIYAKESVKNNSIIGNNDGDSDSVRLNMLNMCTTHLNTIEINKNIKYFVSTLEIEAKRSVPTFESIEILKANIRKTKDIPDSLFFISLGQDNVEGILSGKWANPFTLLNKNIICVPRPSTETNKSLNTMRQLTKILNIDAMLKKQAIEPVPTQDELLSKILIVDINPPFMRSFIYNLLLII